LRNWPAPGERSSCLVSALASNLNFAREALDIFALELPEHYARIAQSLRLAPGRFSVDAEEIALVSTGEHIEITRAARRMTAEMHARISAADVVRLIDGTAMLETLLSDERLEIVASGDVLLFLAEALAIFLDGALSSRSLSDLFERYREWVATSEESPRGVRRAPR
jgi:hypothetical protein